MTPAEVERLGTHGWFLRDGFAGAAVAERVAQGRVDAGLFVRAGLSSDHHRDRAIRNDQLLWVSPDDVELAALLAGFAALQLELNRDAWLGLRRFDLQLGYFPGAGSHYVRHHDASASALRRITAIVYLNTGWQPADGGQLRLHSDPPAQVEPRLSQVVIFSSAKVEHEVLPAWARRLAATAWYYGD